jgi:hypothetical protein
LHADEAFAGFCVADVDYSALGGEVDFFFFATGAEMGLRNVLRTLRRYWATGRLVWRAK